MGRLLFCLLACLSFPGWAGKSFCCADDNGRQVCGDILPQECYGHAYREISERGNILRHVEAPLTNAQIAQRDLEARRKKAEEKIAIEEKRKSQALLNSYSSEQDIEFIRDRALAEIDSALKHAQERHKEALIYKQQLDNEAEFYKKKALPGELKAKIKNNDIELQTQQAAIATKQKEMAAARARFAEDKKRYGELKRGK